MIIKVIFVCFAIFLHAMKAPLTHWSYHGVLSMNIVSKKYLKKIVRYDKIYLENSIFYLNEF